LQFERRVTLLNVVEGMKVRPGLHWQYNTEEECIGAPFGVVQGFNLEEGKVKVLWAHKGWFNVTEKEADHYRIGPSWFDLAVFFF